MQRRASDVLCCCVTVRSTILTIMPILNQSLERWLSRVGKTVIQPSFERVISTYKEPVVILHRFFTLAVTKLF